MKDILEEIDEDIKDIINTKFIYSNTNLVPSSEDNNLTFERGVEKKGKVLNTCVLFVDIRNSVKLNEKHPTETMGKIYTAFTKAVLKVAEYHQGFTRNIIGDRVMIVFPVDNCFTNAVDCAISIYHISHFIINKHFKDVDFKCGIGIDYGELKVIKVGVQKKGDERVDNKNLVWIGYPANIASRLTDYANKEIEETYFKVVRNPKNPVKFSLLYRPPFGQPKIDSRNVPFYLPTIETVNMTTNEFANNINSIKDGELYMMGGNFIRFSKEKRIYIYSPILMTKNVFNGLKKVIPEDDSIKKKYWKEEQHNIKDVNTKVYGGSVTWKI